ncbi:MAG: cell division protein SepF [Clostridia bacterium]|nr:cell division protein SepF [Clostridia bacterium]
MAKVMDKFLGFMGLADEEEEMTEELAHEEEEPAEENSRRKKAPVVSIHQQKQVKVMVMEPRCYEDVQVIADHLKNRRAVVVNLETADKELSRRVVDFVSGCIYALNGSLQKVGAGIYLFVPSNVDISSVIPQDESKDKGLFTWVR